MDTPRGYSSAMLTHSPAPRQLRPALLPVSPTTRPPGSWMRPRVLAVVALVFAVVATSPAGAAAPRELSWEDLVPAAGTPPPPLPDSLQKALPQNEPGMTAPGTAGGNFEPMFPYNPVASLDGRMPHVEVALL